VHRRPGTRLEPWCATFCHSEPLFFVASTSSEPFCGHVMYASHVLTIPRLHASDMEGQDRVNILLKQLDAQRDAYQDTFQQIHELLAQNIAATVPTVSKDVPATPLPAVSGITGTRSPRPSLSGTTADHSIYSRKRSAGLATLDTSADSKHTGEDSDDDEDEELYVSDTLEPQSHTEDTLRKHLHLRIAATSATVLYSTSVPMGHCFQLSIGKSSKSLHELKPSGTASRMSIRRTRSAML
jgi:hypothetical protein